MMSLSVHFPSLIMGMVIGMLILVVIFVGWGTIINKKKK